MREDFEGGGGAHLIHGRQHVLDFGLELMSALGKVGACKHACHVAPREVW